MRILFCLLHFGYHRNFAPVIRELARRGHQIHIGAEKGDRDKARGILEDLCQEFPNVTLGTLPPREKDEYRELGPRLRLGFDYLRYLEPAYSGMPGLRLRSAERTPVGLLRLVEKPGLRSAPARALLRGALRLLEKGVPPSRDIEAYLLAQNPDVMMVTPLIGVVGSYQIDYLATAKKLGIRTGFCVWSWDNLSSKALIRDKPDRVFVWNDTQKQEAVQLHGIPDADVVVSGAQCFDQWFGRAPSRSREKFCREVGLPDAGPYVLYVGSTMVHKSPPEANFVVRWIRHLRASSNPTVRDVNILVRPHPGRLDEWTGIDTSEFERVAFSGLGQTGKGVGAAYPIDTATKNDYFDALYHSAAVVGINTSAFIEAGIIGRPVLAILAPEFSGTQSGTIHFRYLTEVGGGVARAGREFDEHETQLAETLTGSWDHQSRQQGFLEAFVRPRGLDVAATPVFCDAVETLGATPRKRAAHAASGPILATLAVRKLADATSAGRGKLMMMTPDEYAAATINERPRDPYLHKLTHRAGKQLKRARKGLSKLRKRTTQLGVRVASRARRWSSGEA